MVSRTQFPTSGAVKAHCQSPFEVRGKERVELGQVEETTIAVEPRAAVEEEARAGAQVTNTLPMTKVRGTRSKDQRTTSCA